MTEKEIEELKSKVIKENNLYIAKPITLEDFYHLYNNYEHILSEIVFAKKILGVNRQNLNKLKKKNCETIYNMYKQINTVNIVCIIYLEHKL